MIYYAVYNKGWQKGLIITDDYDIEEISRGDHIENIKKDIKAIGCHGPVKVFDINHRLVKILNRAA